MLKLKPGVRIDKLQPQAVLAAVVVHSCYQHLGYECYITSGNDGEHREDSKHYQGLALDFRTKHVPRPLLQTLLQDIKTCLGVDYDVLLENRGEANEHLHVEYDPKN